MSDVEMHSFQTVSDALGAASKILHEQLCDPRAANLFEGVDLKLIDDDVGMGNLRHVICGVQSVRDRRPWSGNGNRTTVDNLTTYLDKT